MAPGRLGRVGGRTALVTGASSGIGASIATQLARDHGFHVVGVARRAGRVDELAGDGLAITSHVADLTDPAQRSAVAERLGDHDVGLLVNCAGVAAHGDLADLDPGRLQEMVALNVGATAELCRAAARAFRARGEGIIVNVASTSAFRAMAGLAAYAATKAFVLQLSLAARIELAPHGVQVTAVCPGPVRTAMIGDALGGELAPAGWQGRLLERFYFHDADACARKALAGVDRGRAVVTTDQVDRAIVRLPRRWIKRIDDLTIPLLTGGGRD